MSTQLAEVFRRQSDWCQGLGSPFYAQLCRSIATALEAGDELEGLLEPWAEADLAPIVADAAQIRLLGALHDLALSGAAPALAAAFPQPGRAADGTAAWSEARRALAAHRDEVAAFLTHEPQTNEVRRSLCLLGGFLTVAKQTSLALRTFELGASAGLNLLWDRFRFRLGDAFWGDAASPVAMDAEWQGPPPPVEARAQVVSRAGCDRRPVDLADAVQRRRLLAFVWPDQFDRMGRLRAAMQLALEVGVRVEACDAPAWARANAAPRPGAATVLYHSVVWQYMPQASQTALRETIAEFGQAASPDAPFAWLRMEPQPGEAAMAVRLTLWPGGEERLLAEVHPHGAWVRWRG